MDAMYAAIKKRKAGGQEIQGDHQDMGHDSQHAADGDKDLHGLVASLSDHEKGALKNILDKDMGGAQDIQKGGPSTEEKGKIDDAIAEENQENALKANDQDTAHPQIDSDEIGKSMLDSRYTGAGPIPPARNLGERVKSGIAHKLKGKGKL